MATPSHLLALPVETRTRVYSYLLPFVGRDWWNSKLVWWQYNNDHDEYSYYDGELPQTTTTFMRTCRQIYHEAADYLYSRGRVGIEIDGESLRMLRLDFKPAIQAAPCTGAFTYVRRLDFRIVLNLHHGPDLHKICTTYMTTAYLAKLVKQHQLHDVSMILAMFLPQESMSHEKKDMSAQLSQHRTGDMTWQHIAAFVMDPLRELQVRPGGKVNFDPPLYTPQVFQMPAFQHLPADLTDAIRSSTSSKRPELVNNYSGFLPYLSALHTVCALLQTFCDHSSLDANEVAYCELAQHSEEKLHDIRSAVVRSDIEALRVHHVEYIRRLLLILPDPSVCSPDSSALATKESSLMLQLLSNDQAVALSYALTMLAFAFPQDIDTFDLGAMHVERAMERWRMHNLARNEETEEGEEERGSYVDFDNGVRDEIYYFKELKCGGCCFPK